MSAEHGVVGKLSVVNRIVRMRAGRIDLGTDDAVGGSDDPVFGDLIAEAI